MIMPKNFFALMKAHTSGGRSRHSQLIFQSSSMAQSSSTGPLRKAFSSSVSVAGGLDNSFPKSGLPVKKSPPPQTPPASSASRSVSDIDGSTPRAQEKIGLVMVSRRKLMGMSSALASESAWPTANLAETVKIQAALHVEIMRI